MSSWLAPPAFLNGLFAQLSTELLAQRKFWVRTLPRGKNAAALFGEASAASYAAIILLLCVLAVFYLKVTVFARSFGSCRLSARALGRTQCLWGLLSTLAGLAGLVAEILHAGGGARLLNGLAGGTVRPFRLPLSWALTWNSLAVDAAFTLLASAPLFLQCLVALAPALAASAYPPFPPPARDGKDAKGAPAPAAPALGSAAEALRALDCCDLVLARLLELAIMYCLHKYQR